MSKRALVTGITGQDGAYLAQFLLGKGYQVFGTFRRTSSPNFWRLQALGILERVDLVPADLTDMSSLLEAIDLSKPDEIYNLAAQSFVGASFEKPLMTTDVDGLGTTRILEVIRILDRKIKFYQASSSEIYGNVQAHELPITEKTPKKPVSPYAAAKLYSYRMTQIYRQAYDIFATNGILFNHESPLRGLEFVTRKISNGVARIALGLEDKLCMGNLEARRDWGYAPEYVDSMWRMLQHSEPGDFVIATGSSHSVRDFLTTAFKLVGLDWQRHVQTDRRHLRPIEVNCLQGDSTRAKEILGWQPECSFERLVSIMVEADMERWRRMLRGEIFPWDAPNHPKEAQIRTRVLRI